MKTPRRRRLKPWMPACAGMTKKPKGYLAVAHQLKRLRRHTQQKTT
ncbi:hypothetical protein [Chitinilyticum litopenaei]|nr:hypothetical protein [Chitinilyticum litopenaei]